MISATAPAGIDVADYLDNEVVPALENIGGVAPGRAVRRPG